MSSTGLDSAATAATFCSLKDKPIPSAVVRENIKQLQRIAARRGDWVEKVENRGTWWFIDHQ